MDVTESTFQTAVIERSHSVPVVVDFWASWCGPCLQLGPVLEREAAKRTGKVELVKLDVDSNQALSRTYGIQGIPAVKAFDKGRVVAEFVGAQPATAVARFLDSLIPNEAEILARMGDEESLRKALELEPERADAAVKLARIVYGRGEREEALEILGHVHGSFAADGLAARIRLEGSGAPDLGPAFSALDAGHYEPALDILIDAVASARGARDEIRRVVVGVLDELGMDDPLASRSRSKLASALY
ncbi:MAG TPA: tetratricopeptide repeat protein [Patescibacteria group bacterium]|nr:tetratricopeptide repeat protein [Patescibacteria group bacterium]